jgi:AcrR family transcriptional regulator
MPPATRQPARRTQAERSKATTADLLDAARGLFAADGYRATSLEDIVAAAGLTKGALYHHFSGKDDLFREVFAREERALAERQLAAYRRKRDPWAGLYASCKAFFEASLDPGVQRITLLDAPAVLGWEQMRAIEADRGLAHLQETLALLMKAKRISPRPVGPLAHLLHGAMCEGAMMVARSEDQNAANRQVMRELRTLLDALGPKSKR